jgi:hypothetical protein
LIGSKSSGSQRDETIALTSPDDWLDRPSFHAELIAPRDSLDRIIGKYDLARPAAGTPAGTGMVVCGLNNCHTKHYRGFLIRLKDGRETIIGQDCGAREFHTSWEDVEAVFRAQESRRAAQEVINNLRHSRAAYLERAHALLPLCEQLHKRLAEVRKQLKPHEMFWKQLQAVARQGGRVMAEIDDGGESKRATGKVAVGTVATINECSLLLADTGQYTRTLKFDVIAWLESSFEEQAAAAGEDLKKLRAITKIAAAIESHLREAAAFVTRGAELLRPENLANIRAIELHLLSQRQRTSALARALRRALELRAP